MTKGKWLMLTGGLLAAAVLCFAWSAVLTLLLGRALNGMEPWAVVSFMAEHGFSGRSGSLLFRSFLMAFVATAALAAAAWGLATSRSPASSPPPNQKAAPQ